MANPFEGPAQYQTRYDPNVGYVTNQVGGQVTSPWTQPVYYGASLGYDYANQQQPEQPPQGTNPVQNEPYNPVQRLGRILGGLGRMFRGGGMMNPPISRGFAPPPGGAPTGAQYGRDQQLTMRDLRNPNVTLSPTDRQYLGGLPFYNYPNSQRAYDFGVKMGTPGMDQWQRPEAPARQMPRPGRDQGGFPGANRSMPRRFGQNEPPRKKPNRPIDRSQQPGRNG